jgi:hypothetical protein
MEKEEWLEWARGYANSLDPFYALRINKPLEVRYSEKAK